VSVGDGARGQHPRAGVRSPGAAVPVGTLNSAAPACPATGRWSECAVIERLERAGLIPRRDSAPVAEAPLTPRGFRLTLGNAQLEVYLYPTASELRRELAQVDTTRYLGYTEAVSMQELPTLIRNENLVAILHSRNDHQRERIGDALTAGPPQPARDGGPGNATTPTPRP
jgi:hypothetical protein